MKQHQGVFMKTVLFMIIALFTQLTFANEWKQINQNLRDHSVRISYTTAWSPATYGSQGGNHEGILYVDVYSKNDSVADSVEIFEVLNDGRLNRISNFHFIEDNARHHYAQKPAAKTYADFLWFGKNYRLKMSVNGQTLESNFRL
jgi:hypothetical protein